jgi:hypothetical protein
MKRTTLSRRTLLRGAGVSMALPWLEAMALPARKAGAAGLFPKRFISFTQPNGYIRDAWVPTGGETDFKLSRSLAPLEPVRSDVLILEGVDNRAATRGPGDDHMRGMGTMLTGIELLPGTLQGGAGAPAGLAGGISVDQEIVRNAQVRTKVPSLELGVQSARTGTVYGYSVYRDKAAPLPLENNPRTAFNRLFAEFDPTGTDVTLKRLQEERRSVLDAVRGSYSDLARRLGVDDRQKLEAHADAVRELELNATSVGNQLQACAKPGIPELDARANAEVPRIGKVQMDLIVMALACDLTRVATLQWAHSAGTYRFFWLGIQKGTHHGLSHKEDTDLQNVEYLTRIDHWFAQQFAYLVQALKGVREGQGTMLDNSLVLWSNELCKGNRHSHAKMPYVLAGRAGGAVKTGRFLSYGDQPHNDLLIAILRAMDINATTFGNPAYCRGPLPGMLNM